MVGNVAANAVEKSLMVGSVSGVPPDSKRDSCAPSFVLDREENFYMPNPEFIWPVARARFYPYINYI